MIAGADPTRALLGTAWAALGGRPDLLELVETVGDGTGLLASTLPALPAILAAVSASTLAASVLDGARRGKPAERVRVDVEHAALAARSERYARLEGTAAANPFARLSRFWQTAAFARLSRFWQTADGWLRLHANYDWHRERALGVLGTDERPEAVGAAIRAWRGADLEDALAAAGGVGSAVRSQREWSRHPQGLALAGLPLLDATAGPGPGRRPGPGRAATGVRVLDLTRVIAGPVATRTLAAWGADVLRLDSPRLPEIPAQALDTLQGKRSALLDFAEPAGGARLEELLAAADVLIHGYRPGALDRFGFARGDLAERHPQLCVVSLSAWGAAGPWAGRRGFDSLVQCPTGIALAEGTDGAPGALPAQVLDHATGYLAAAAVLLGLAGVEQGGSPSSAELSLAQTAGWLQSTGAGQREPPRELGPKGRLVELAGAARPVWVIRAPGRVGDLVPSWSATTELGADPPAFDAQASGSSAPPTPPTPPDPATPPIPPTRPAPPASPAASP